MATYKSHRDSDGSRSRSNMREEDFALSQSQKKLKNLYGMSTTLQHFLQKRIEKPELRFKFKPKDSDSEEEEPKQTKSPS